MLFVSPEFLLIFLPIVLAGYWLLERWNPKGGSMAWLLVASLVFYSYSGAPELLLFVLSLSANYALGKWVARTEWRGAFAVGVGLNLALLAWFKYADFGIGIVKSVTGWELPLLHLRLPLAISFYTFQQIAYLAKCRREKQASISWHDYALAVAFFPHLIAGPLVHYHALVSQFHSDDRKRLAALRVYEAASMFIIALGKKLLVADSLSPIAAEIFGRAGAGASLGMGEAWLGALAYTFQIYFDFSAYSEMAMALALMFGLELPVNFRQPYRAVDLRDFWKRWHITLSEFLRDYVYIPLGGSRCSATRRWLNLFLTMLIGGLWHGAGWNFIAWGGLHGALLAVNHAWAARSPVRLPVPLARVLTFAVVVLLWVPFRAETWNTTTRVWTAMAGGSTAPAPATVEGEASAPEEDQLHGVLGAIATAREAKWDGAFWKVLWQKGTGSIVLVLLSAVLVFTCRSNLELSAGEQAKSAWRAVLLGLLLFAIAARNFHAPPGEFLYFRF